MEKHRQILAIRCVESVNVAIILVLQVFFLALRMYLSSFVPIDRYTVGSTKVQKFNSKVYYLNNEVL